MSLASAPAYALAAALLSALATIFIRHGLRGSDPYVGVWINLMVGTVGLWIAVAATGGIGHPTATGVLLFLLAGLIGTVGGRVFRFVSIEKVGPSISAALTNLHPLVAATLAILLLGDPVTVPILAGTAVIVVGTALLSFGGPQRGFRARYLWLPLGSAFCFGIVAILRKVGLGHVGVVMGSAINVTTAMVAFSAFVLASRRGGTMTCDRRSLGWFVAAGVTENLSVFLNVVALGLATVSVVSPLVGSSPIFVLFLSFLFLRDVELLSTRIVIGTLLTVVGVVLITLFR